MSTDITAQRPPDTERTPSTEPNEPVTGAGAPMSSMMGGAVANLGAGLVQRKLARRRQESVQRRAGGVMSALGGAGGGEQIHDVAARGVSGGGGALPHLDKIQASFGAEHDVSHVGAHVGGSAGIAATQIGASAYAMGNQVAFAQPPDLHTAAHEAAHVVQQRGGVQLKGGVGEEGDVHERHADAVADRVVRGESSRDLLATYGAGAPGAGIQMRRLPADLAALLRDPSKPDANGPNFDANFDGELLLIERAVAELKPAELTQVQQKVLAGQSPLTFLFTVPPRELLIRVSDAITAVRPDLKLGDPALIDTGPRKGTDDAAHLKKLVANAKKVINSITSGAHNKDLGQVFGTKHIDEARAKYAAARTWMETLNKQEKIVTDRSGYSDEVSLGGLTGFQRQIALSPDNIDNPDSADSIVTLIHEALHAGNKDVSDKGYIHQPSFTELPEDVKLTNAAHFEVVPRRILKTSFAFDGQTFIPAGATVGGVTAPSLSDTEQAIRGASEAFRTAWTIGLNLHSLFLRVYKNPTWWDTKPGGGKTYKDGIPYWSKVEKMTVHRKTVIDPSSSDAAKQPISQIDMALSEGLVRKLALAMETVPQKESDAQAFEKAHASEAEMKAGQASVDAHRDLLMKLVLKQPGVAPITGPVERDFRVVQELVNLKWGDVLNKRDPASFAD